MLEYDPFTNCNTSLYEISATYVQPADTDSDKDDIQYLKIDSMSVPGCDEPYYRISLPEGGFWSVNGPEDIIDLFNDFKEKLNIKICQKKK